MWRFIIQAALFVGLHSPAFADKLPLAQVSSYLNRLQSTQGEFTQVNDDGSVVNGRVYIKRPGRIRFEYDDPGSPLVVANKNKIVIRDPKSNLPSERYLLRHTPLSIILAKNIDLGRARMVTGHRFDGTATIITAQDPKNPEYGNIKMKFTSDPIALRQWVITDSAGVQSTVVLREMQVGQKIDDALFDITMGKEDTGVTR